MPQETMRRLSYNIASSQHKLSELQASKEDILKQIKQAVQQHDSVLKEIEVKKAANRAHMKNMAALEAHHTQNEQQIQQCTQQIKQFEAKLHAMQQNHLPEPGLYANTHLVNQPYVSFLESQKHLQAQGPHLQAQGQSNAQAAARKKHFYTTSTNRQMRMFVENATEPHLTPSGKERTGLFVAKHEEPLRAWNPFDDFFNFIGGIAGGEKHLSSHAKQMKKAQRET